MLKTTGTSFPSKYYSCITVIPQGRTLGRIVQMAVLEWKVSLSNEKVGVGERC